MDGPGTSLFQGSGALNLNHTNTEEDEAEALEEEAHRLAQLQEMMANGFDDLPLPTHHEEQDESFASSGHHLNNSAHLNFQSDDEVADQQNNIHRVMMRHAVDKLTNGTMNGDTALSAHYNHCFHNNRPTDADSTSDKSASLYKDKAHGGGDMEQLAELYGVRMREMARLQEHGVQREAEWSQQCNALQKKNMRLEAEKATAQTACTQAQALLMSSKEQVAELIKELEFVRQRYKTLETKNEDVERELLVSRTTVDTLQAKVAILERGSVQRAGEAHMDSLLKSLQERHRKEITSLQQQLDAQTSKLENTERALKEAEQRVWEETRRHENMLMEKSEAINRLNRALEESQRHCQELVTAQQQQQQPSLLSALSDKKLLQDKVARLQAELEWAKADVDQLETLVGLGVLSCNDSEWLEKGKKKSGALSSMEGLRDELTRSLRNQEARRIEIKRLSQELREREQDIMEMKQQESKYEQVVNTLKERSENLLYQLNQLKQKQPPQSDDATVKKLSQENAQLRQCNSELKLKESEMQEHIDNLKDQNDALAEQSVELQRAADEEKHKTLDNHTKEYLAFHQRAVASARQQEREQAERELADLRLELALEKKNCDEVKTAYVSMSQAKASVLAELEQLRIQLQQTESKQPVGENEQQFRMQYEQKVAAEVQKAKQSVLREVEQERQAILEQARRTTENEIEERLASAKAEWEATQTPVQLVGDDKLREEILRLKQMVQNQAEALKRERQLAEEQVWSHFQEELQRVTETPVVSKHAECRDRATSPIPSLESASSNSPSDTPNSDLVKQVQMLQLLLEDTKSKHASKLADLQTHLQEKHQEMEDFKKKVIEFTKMRDEAQEKDSMKYINTLKQEIASLTAELSENKKVSDTERTKLKSMIESWTSELQSLKTDKKNTESKLAILQKKFNLLQEKHTQLKDYYERRENYIRQEHKKREEKFFETLIKLKTEIDSLSHLQFPKFSNVSEQPTKDV